MDTNQPELPEDSKKAASVPKGPAGEASPGRRGLLKAGAFVPPVMLTLRSGAALAQASNLACLAANQAESQQADSRQPSLGVSQTADQWARTPVVLREARRVRKRQGVWSFKGERVEKLYTHRKSNGVVWTSLKPGRSGRKWRLMDTGRDIPILDAATGETLLTGSLLVRADNPRRRYVSVLETEALGLLQFDQNGDLIVNEDGEPDISESLQATADQPPGGALTTSCWASLNPSVSLPG